jgi:cytochrome c biogenesis protein CcmG/thiol:disulfide interchange protein DsbE
MMPTEPAKKWLFIPLIILVLLGGIFFKLIGEDQSVLPSQKIGQPIPEVVLPLYDFKTGQMAAESVNTSSWKGRPFLLSLWATWCPGCRAEWPILMQLKQSNVLIFGVAYKDQSHKIADWINLKGAPFEQLLLDNNGDFGFEMGAYGTPETYFFDASGRLVGRHIGPMTQQFWEAHWKKKYEAELATVNQVSL